MLVQGDVIHHTYFPTACSLTPWKVHLHQTCEVNLVSTQSVFLPELATSVLTLESYQGHFVYVHRPSIEYVEPAGSLTNYSLQDRTLPYINGLHRSKALPVGAQSSQDTVFLLLRCQLENVISAKLKVITGNLDQA